MVCYGVPCAMVWCALEEVLGDVLRHLYYRLDHHPDEVVHHLLGQRVIRCDAETWPPEGAGRRAHGRDHVALAPQLVSAQQHPVGVVGEHHRDHHRVLVALQLPLEFVGVFGRPEPVASLERVAEVLGHLLRLGNPPRLRIDQLQRLHRGACVVCGAWRREDVAGAVEIQKLYQVVAADDVSSNRGEGLAECPTDERGDTRQAVILLQTTTGLAEDA
mmetsp:Transcript_35778/g.89090  ORF Transcript_35778/g.89090 Transcript_35778/m.89090 type:complete len:217 (-) Transcript_35778:1188-1838(-)